MVVITLVTSEVMVTTLASVRPKLNLRLMLDISVDTMVVIIPVTLEVMVTTLASVRPKLNLRLMLDILVDISVDTMALLLQDTLEAMVTTLASVKLKLMLDISVDTMVDLATVGTMADMLATVDILDKLFNIRANKELFPYDKIHTFYFDLNKLDKYKK